MISCYAPARQRCNRNADRPIDAVIVKLMAPVKLHVGDVILSVFVLLTDKSWIGP